MTLKGKSMIESVDSKLPRVTGISLPKIRKPMDSVDEFIYANQPPPTPVDVSLGGHDRYKGDHSEARSIPQIEENIQAEEIANTTQESSNHPKDTKISADIKQVENKNNETPENQNTVSEVVEVENTISERKTNEIGPVKRVNFSDQQLHSDDKPKEESVSAQDKIDNEKETTDTENVTFFVTEQNNVDKPSNEEENAGNGLDEVIKVEINESEKKNIDDPDSKMATSEDKQHPVTSEDYPFGSGT